MVSIQYKAFKRKVGVYKNTTSDVLKKETYDFAV
jgi:hypothetical protein